MCEYTHSQQTRFDKSPTSCGIVELHHLPAGPPQQVALSLANYLYHKANPRPAAFAMWSDRSGYKEGSRGEVLAQAFVEGPLSRCGRLHESEKVLNPRTGSAIRVWMLTIDHEEFRKWYTEAVMHQLGGEGQ